MTARVERHVIGAFRITIEVRDSSGRFLAEVDGKSIAQGLLEMRSGVPEISYDESSLWLSSPTQEKLLGIWVAMQGRIWEERKHRFVLDSCPNELGTHTKEYCWVCGELRESGNQEQLDEPCEGRYGERHVPSSSPVPQNLPKE